MKFLTYRTFTEKDGVDALTELLRANNIEFEVTEDRDSLDSLYVGKLVNHQIFVKIRQEDFEKANSILSQLEEKEVENADKDHYLFGFTDEELFEIVSKPDEWNEYDYQLSKKILRQRGKKIDDNIIQLLKKQRLNDLSKPEEGQKTWIYAGYLFAMLGGLLGIFIGWHLNTFKKTLSNGQQVYGYTQQDRKHGFRILIIGIIMFITTVIVRIATTDYN